MTCKAPAPRGCLIGHPKLKRKHAMPKTEYIVQTASAHMPNSCRGQYRRVAVMEINQGAAPTMISERARGVIRIVRTWEKQHVGKTPRCAYRRALADAETLASSLNQ